MKSLLKLVATAVFALAFATTSHAATNEELEGMMKDMVSVFEGLGNTMETVKDEASAKAADPKLKELGEKMQGLMAKMATMQPTPEQEKALEGTYKPKVDAAMEKFQKETARIAADPALAAGLAESMKALGGGGGETK